MYVFALPSAKAAALNLPAVGIGMGTPCCSPWTLARQAPSQSCCLCTAPCMHACMHLACTSMARLPMPMGRADCICVLVIRHVAGCRYAGFQGVPRHACMDGWMHSAHICTAPLQQAALVSKKRTQCVSYHGFEAGSKVMMRHLHDTTRQYTFPHKRHTRPEVLQLHHHEPASGCALM